MSIKEKQRLLIKRRKAKKAEEVRVNRVGKMTKLNTEIKNYFGMMKCHIDQDSSLQSVAKTMVSKNPNVFRRAIAHQSHTKDAIQEQLGSIHKYAQSLVNKHILKMNTMKNIMFKLNNMFKKILSNKEYTMERKETL